jgi:Protein of unknown function (DUF5131)
MSAISWTDRGFTPCLGCAKVSGGCDNCYAEDWTVRRFRGHRTSGGCCRRTGATAMRLATAYFSSISPPPFCSVMSFTRCPLRGQRLKAKRRSLRFAFLVYSRTKIWAQPGGLIA